MNAKEYEDLMSDEPWEEEEEYEDNGGYKPGLTLRDKVIATVVTMGVISGTGYYLMSKYDKLQEEALNPQAKSGKVEQIIADTTLKDTSSLEDSLKRELEKAIRAGRKLPSGMVSGY